MILREIEPFHFGPFRPGTKLVVDPEVTVLTGPNDTGKSSLLRLIRMVFRREAAQEADYNNFRIGEFKDGWQRDPELGAILTFAISKDWSAYLNPGHQGSLMSGDTLRIRAHIAGEAMAIEPVELRREGRVTNLKVPLARFPAVVFLPSESDIKDIIDLTSMTPSEERLVKLGFGGDFSYPNHKSFSPLGRATKLNEVKKCLNRRLREILPPSLKLEFELIELGGDPKTLGVSIVDEHTGLTPIGYRGTGVRRIIGLMGDLLALKSADTFTYILIDEPENSLHADAQHALRQILEQLAKSERIQVLYATHSPSMINTMRPGSIRVLSRRRDGDEATSVIENKAFDKNYYRVRSSLGLNPSDSLLYAPVTVIVEGATEVLCIPYLLMKLKEAGHAGFDDLESLLSHTHFLDGEGASYEYMCRLAKSQNATPVLFVDGDQTDSVTTARAKHPEVKIIELQKDSEFEQVVPNDRYIEAVASVLGDNTGAITLASFEAWRMSQRKRLAFSKLVERWLQDEHDAKPLYKPIVMKKAIELTDVSDLLQQDAFRELIVAIRDSLPF